MLSHHYDYEKKEAPQTRTKEDYKMMLLKNFGGKNAQRSLYKQQRMALNIDVVKDQLNKTVAGKLIFPVSNFQIFVICFILFLGIADVKIEDESKKNVEDTFAIKKIEQEEYLKSMIPPVNRNAKTLSEVYNVTDLIDPILFDRMDEEAHALLKTPFSDIPLVFYSIYLFS